MLTFWPGVLAVTRALGDSYMKDLVTGHPYTTESVLQSDLDEFIILACDGVCFPTNNETSIYHSVSDHCNCSSGMSAPIKRL
jgi:protein phosphatase PTC1